MLTELYKFPTDETYVCDFIDLKQSNPSATFQLLSPQNINNNKIQNKTKRTKKQKTQQKI